MRTSFLAAFVAGVCGASLAILATSCAPTAPASLARPVASDVETPPVVVRERVAALERVAVIGASLSAGFRIDGGKDPFQPSRLQLADVVDASIVVPHGTVTNLATAGFFLDPEGQRRATIARLTEAPPSAIVALDYLFWFAHGANVPDERRLASVEAALADLGRFECPILLGDLPDMTVATRVALPMLRAKNLPSPATRDAMNAAISRFAASRPRVVIVPLADLVRRLLADEALTVRGTTWPAGSIGVLLQGDRLHPTLEGTCAVWTLAVDRWLARDAGVPESAFDLDARKLAEALRGRLAAGAGGAARAR